MTNENTGRKISEDLRYRKIGMDDLSEHEAELLFSYLQKECRKIVEADSNTIKLFNN